MHAMRTRFLPFFNGVRTFAANSGKPGSNDISNLMKKLAGHEKAQPPKKMSAVSSEVPIEGLPAAKKKQTKKSKVPNENVLSAEKKEQTMQKLPKKHKNIKKELAQDVLDKDKPTENVIAKNKPVEKEVPVEKEITVEKEVPVEKELLVEKEVPVEKEVLVEKEVPVEKEVLVEKEVPVKNEVRVEKDTHVTDPDLLKLSNLLQALEMDATTPGKPAPSISGIFSGLKLDVKKMRPLTSHSPLFIQPAPSKSYLLTGQGLGIFDTKTIAEFRTAGCESESLFDQLERESLENSVRTIPRNFFEEAIDLTKEGKLWNFPISNEQGLEADASFHEHIFLERYLPLFPNKGPVRHFMELVVNGLSKNAFLTVKEKEDHILWFAEYFKDKKIEVEA